MRTLPLLDAWLDWREQYQVPQLQVPFVNDSPLQSTLRELHGLSRDARFWIVLGVIAAIVGLIGPFGTYRVLGVAPRVFAGDAEKPAYPYLEVSRHAVEDVSGADALMWRHELDLAVMTSVGGREEAWEAADAVRAVIDAGALSVAGHRCVLAAAPFIDVMRSSVHLWRAIVRVRLQVELAP